MLRRVVCEKFTDLSKELCASIFMIEDEGKPTTPWKRMGEWKYNSTILHLRTGWKCVQRHAPAALPPRKETSVPIGWASWLKR
jgi:hypothetical protein